MHYACVTHELDLHDVIGRFARTHVQFVRNYTSEYCALAQINLIDDLAEGAYILHAVQVSFILASNLYLFALRSSVCLSSSQLAVY